MDYGSVRLHTIVLLLTWLAGTTLVLVASSAAPLTGADLGLLRANAGWYAAGYGLFFVADCAIALMGVSVMAALAPEGRFRGPAIVVLFALSGMFGVLADVAMVGAAQLLSTGSPLLAPATAAAFPRRAQHLLQLAVRGQLPAGSARHLARGPLGVGQPRLDRLHLHFGAIPARHRAALRRLLRRHNRCSPTSPSSWR